MAKLSLAVVKVWQKYTRTESFSYLRQPTRRPIRLRQAVPSSDIGRIEIIGEIAGAGECPTGTEVGVVGAAHRRVALAAALDGRLEPRRAESQVAVFPSTSPRQRARAVARPRGDARAGTQVA